jgi:hypothetical protein
MKKILKFTYFFIFAMLFCTRYAYAYLDPSALTYMVQIIAGVFIAGGAAIGIFWSRLKRKVKGKKIEEDTRETIDVDDINDEI